MGNFNVTYHCGCIHEIEDDGGFKPTGKNTDCEIHKKGEWLKWEIKY